MSAYGYALGEEAVHAFASLPFRQRAKLLRVLDALTRRPNQPGDYQETGASGRIFEVTLADDLLLTWWTDHAVKEVRIVRIEFAD
jgi:hypothetical protein